MAFLEAVELLGPRSIDDVRRAAFATLSPARERAGEFDALFRAWFHGEFAPVPGESEDETEVRIHDEGEGVFEGRGAACGVRRQPLRGVTPGTARGRAAESRSR